MGNHAGAVTVDEEREWVRWEGLDYDDRDFPTCGAAFESERSNTVERTIGVGDTTLFRSQSCLFLD